MTPKATNSPEEVLMQSLENLCRSLKDLVDEQNLLIEYLKKGNLDLVAKNEAEEIASTRSVNIVSIASRAQSGVHYRN